MDYIPKGSPQLKDFGFWLKFPQRPLLCLNNRIVNLKVFIISAFSKPFFQLMWPLSILIIPDSPFSPFCSLFSFLSDRFERSKWFLLSKAKGWWQSDRSIRIIPPKGKSIENEELKWPSLHNNFGKVWILRTQLFFLGEIAIGKRCKHNFPLLFRDCT